ncbi:MAG: HYR domain-containing protein, partial [Saprospirales bacterium]
PAIDAGNPDTTGLNLPLLDLDDNPRLFNATGSAEAIIDMGAYEFQSTLPDSDIIYVNAALPTSGNGTSWECAFTDLQAALAIAEEGNEIWVAAGTYYPTSDPLNRDAKFFLKQGVALYGGFTGDEQDRDERDWINNETILSGDINQTGLDDGNSYNVVDASCGSPENLDCPDENTILDGFTITMGYGDGMGNNRAGAGLLSIYGRPTVRNCTFWGNYAELGGGAIYNFEGEMLIQNCLFHDNYDELGSGSALFFSGSFAEIHNSTFFANTSNSNAGALFAEFGSSIEVINSIFWENGSTDFSFSGPDDPVVSYSLIQQQSGTYPGTGNLNVNPFFVDADLRNFKLSDCSPAIDAGNPDTTGLNLPELDLAGNPRVFNATGGPDRIDIGAYEFQSTISFSEVIYVNVNNPNPGTGISWDCALNDLQQALSVADSGAVIWVAEGTYLPTSGSDRTISFEMKEGVALYGGFEGNETDLSERDPENNVTVLSGDIGVQGDTSDNSYQVVTAGGGISNVILDGFTITLGNADGGGSNVQGAGMRVFGGASVTIENCKFVGNHADDRGAGMKVLSSTATIRNSIFQSNTAEIGAGLLANTNANVVVENSIFRNNEANVRGGGVFYNSSSGELRNCLFFNNTAGTEGGAVMMAVSASLEIINSTFANNFAADGGGLRIAGSFANIANSIFWGNGDEINGSVNSVSYSIIEGGFSGVGNFSADPLFSDPEGNVFTLQACSPAIDAGDNDALSVSDSLDLAGNPRLFDATELGSPTVDMGAYEFQAVVPAAGNPNVIYVDASNASSGSGRSWACAFTDLQNALAVAQEGDTIWVAQGSYSPTDDSDPEVSFELVSGVVMLGGFNGTETSADQRNWENNPTILDGDNGMGPNSNRVVYADNVDSTTVLDGFTIQGSQNFGSPTSLGGGMYISFGAPIIRNCTIQNNLAFEGGGGVYIESASPVFINTTFFGNSTSEGFYGGAVYAYFANPHFEECHFEQNFAFFGAGIYSEGSNISIKNTGFTQEFASISGGGILAEFGSQITIENATFSENEAGTGGAIAVEGSELIISGSNFTDNASFFGSGGAISSSEIFSISNIHIFSSTFSNNSSPENCGGAISLAGMGATLTIDSTDFIGNEAATGGAVCIEDSGQGTLSHVSFLENEGFFAGGAIYASDAGLLSINNGDFQENSSTEDGGSIFSSATLTFSIDSSEFILNAADSLGGAVFHAQDTLVLTNSYFYENTAHSGGAIYTSEGGLQVSFTDFESNIAAYRGGAHCALESKDDYEHVNFKKNEAAKGGAVFGDKTKSKFLHTKAKENKAQQKGGAYYKKDAEVEKKHSKIEENESESGGGIYSKKSEMYIDSSEFIKNMALEDGGGFKGDSSKTYFKNSKFEENEAKNGGGIKTDGCEAELDRTELKKNMASEKGGGMKNKGSKIDIKDSKIGQNEAGDDGGGIKGDSSKTDIKNSVFEKNKAKKGGAIATKGCDFNVKDTDIMDNEADEEGGGVYHENTKKLYDGVNVKNNKAEKDGGGMKIKHAQDSSKMKNVNVRDNSSQEKGGGMATDSSKIEFENCNFSKNKSEKGGNIYNNKSNCKYKNTKITAGKANKGGGMYNKKSSPEMINCQVTGNVALNQMNFQINQTAVRSMQGFLDGEGGGFFNEEGSPRLINLTLSGNFADDNGGGMYNTDSSNAEVSNTIVYNNQSGDGQDTLNSNVSNENSNPTFNNSVVEGANGSDDWNPEAGNDSGGNFDFDPQFVNELDPSSEPSEGGNFRLAGNSSAIDSGNDDDVPEDIETDIIGNARTSLFGVDIGAYERQSCQFDATNTIFVDANRTDSVGTGQSWETAFTELFDALFLALDCDSTFFIFIAEGTYYPTDDPTDREGAVFLRNSLNILGGFPGEGSPDLTDRDWREFHTTISGDINRSGDSEGNSYSVVAAFDADSSAVLDGVTIRDGNADGMNGSPLSPLRAGAGVYIIGSDPTLINLRIEENTAETGAGMLITGSASPSLYQIEILNNTALENGGGLADISFEGQDTVIWSNLLIAGNSAGENGGGLYLENQRNRIFLNTTVTQNMAEEEGSAVYNDNSLSHFRNSIFWENQGSIFNLGSALTADFSLIQLPVGVYPGIGNFNANPFFSDPDALDFSLTGCSPAINAGTSEFAPDVDLLGNIRPANSNVDMGAYEFQGTPEENCCPEGEIIYVNHQAQGVNNGSDWVNAFTDLQDALDLVCPEVTQIWIAEGTYYPTTDTMDRDSSFVIPSGISVYGGFQGDEESVEERNWYLNRTILSGDINESGTLDGNSHTVVVIEDAQSEVLLDGLFITKGNADGYLGMVVGPHNSGGGLYIDNSLVVGRNLYVEDNTSVHSGAGISIFESEVDLVNMVVTANYSEFQGGGLFLDGQSEVSLINATFSGNKSDNEGGAVYSQQGNLSIFNSIIWNNSADSDTESLSASISDLGTGLSISHSLISGSGGSGTHWNLPVASDGGGNLDVDPLFVGNVDFSAFPSASGDLNLTSCSPALDRGLNSAVQNLVSEDIGSDPRLFNSTDIDSAVVDMGAYEFQGEAEFPDLNCDDISVFLDEVGEKELTDDQLVPDAESCGTLGISWSGFDSLSFDCSNTGTYIVSMVGTDSASLRMDSCQFELTVSDTIDPVVTCSDATIDLDANGIATLEVGDFNYFASSNCAFDTLYVNNSEFSCSDVGTNIFEFVVTDINNNTTICSAEVEVINPFTPQVDCRDTSIVLVDTDMAIIEPGDIGEVIGSNCAIDSVWIDMNSLGCPEVGPNTVQFFAVDITGKKDSCSSEITIVDEIVTMAQCKNLTVYLDSLGNASIQPEEVDDHSILSCSIIDSQLDKSDFSCMDVGEFPVITLSFLDGDGTVGHCNSIVEVLDTIAPFVECEDVTIEIEPGDAFVILDPDTLVGSDSFDACGIATSAVDKDTFFLQDLGENTVELTVQDPSDNAVTCSAVVTVEGCPPFNLDCPAPDTIYVESGCAIVNLNYESATSNDSPCPLEFSQLPYWGQLLNPGVYTQLVSAEDPAGNTASCSFELTLKDTIPPTVSCPEDGVVYVNEDCNGFLDDYTGEVDANDNCGISQIVQMPSAGFSMTADDTTEVTITVFDQSDNSATCSFFIVAVDTISPTLQCDEDLIVRYVDGNCQEEVGDLTSLANPEDNCVTSFTTVQDIAADFVISAGDELTVTLSVSNENGWSGSCEIPVMAVDTLEPQLTCLIDSDTVQVDIDCNASLGDYTGYAFVSDNCLAPGDFAVSQSPAAGFNLSPGDEFSVNLVTSDNGQWEDSCQINIVVVHPFDPVLNCQTENIVREVGPQCLAEVGDLTSIATVSDNCLTGDAFTIVQNIPQDSMIGAGVSVNAVVNVSDTTGWSAQCSVAVSAINESVFSWQDPLPTDDTLSCALGAEIISLTLSDFCDTLSVYPSADTTMGCMGIETLVFTWIFEDLSHSQTIVFVDNTPPVWLTHPLPQDTTVECDQIPAPVTLEAEDLCSEVNIEFEEEVLGDTIAGSYTLSRSWSAADHCGNEIDHQQLLTVVDLTPPTIACPDTVVIDADEHCSVTMPDLRAQVTVDDNCSAIPNISINQIPSQGLTVIVEEITVFAVAIDEAGNSITCTFILKVENFGQDASIQCPEPVSVNAQEGDCYKFVEFEASFTQGCDGVVIVNDFNSGAEDASGVYPLGTTEVSFVLSQNGQPADSCVSSVEVLDVEVPELTCPDDIAVDTDPDACLATGILPGEAWASSTCGNVLVSVDIPTSLEIGLNTIVHTAEADNGQTAQCEQIVEVHDANPPSIDCPDDLTVQVDSGQCVASGVETGDATATSLCGEVEIESDAPEIFSVGTTIVTYTATSDNDLEANCEQQVTITWMDAVEINCPDDITKVLIGGDCELEDLDLGTPVLMPLCGDISIGNDAPGVFEAGITAVTHTATLPNGTELTCVQEVEVIDNYPISIVCPESLVFITEPGICEVVNPDVGEAEVFTVCQSATVESDVPAVLLPGTHTVTHTASTGSGIEVSCEQIVEVQDHEDPTIVCPDDKAVQIPLGSSNAQVDLSLATAHDNCGIDQISNNWNSGGADASGFYPSGETSVIFTALDVNGNSSSCVTLVSVQLVDTSLYSISGNVSSWNNVGMSDVELVLSSGLSESHFTDVDGDYQFAVPGSINLIISPEKDISWPTGISVVDLVMTQRHILQIETFDSPYRIIAADVNGSGSNSTIDLVIMQSIILGINNAEPNISPMIFIPADYQFSNPQNPFINNWPENLAFQSVSGNKADQDFVAIKRGDVSGTAFSGIRLAAANPLELTLDVKNHENEGHIEVVVSGSVEKSMRGYQMEFSFDPGSLNFEGVEVKGSKMPDMRDELFHFDQENGVIRAIWYNAESVDLSNEKQLFSLRFSKSNPSISVKDHFGLITSPQGLMTFATGPDHPKIPIVSDWRSSEGVSVPGIIDVSPNPFRDLAVVNFEMPENQSVNIRVFDAAGAVIYDTRFHAVEGLNRYDLKLDGEFSGALYLLLETSDWNQVINLMRIE